VSPTSTSASTEALFGDVGAASPGARVADEPVVLAVRGLRTEFAGDGTTVTAVRDVSFDLRRRERLGVVGESGSGKSVLVRSILGLVEHPGRVVAGQVSLDGRSLTDMGERQLRSIRGNEVALISQDPMTGFNPLAPIGRQIVEAIRLHRDVSRRAARREAIELLREVEIPDPERRIDDHPHQFSGGMRQRAMIAMALANSPQVLLADEPTTALDVTTQAAFLRTLERTSDERGASVILITHDLGVVAEVCDTVQVMYAGQVVERGPCAEILEDPKHPYTRALLRSIVRMGAARTARLPAISGSPPDLASCSVGCAFEPRCAEALGARCRHTDPAVVHLTTAAGRVDVRCHLYDAPAGPVAP
jgi:oligopeptide/dipeptide ABC transporter ATP-binding protein